MRLRSQKTIVFVIIRGGFLMSVLMVCPTAGLSSELHRSSIVCRQEFSTSRRNELAARLRAITGWRDLGFQDDGALLPGVKKTSSGSLTARDLITQAQSDQKILILEDASDRIDVAFARVVRGFWKSNVNLQPPVFVVLIDFADFDHLMGDSKALSAFNVGWALLHEIEHVVNGWDDPDNPGETGACEAQINRMRGECNLPQRTDYFSTLFPHTQDSAFITKLVRLAFDQQDPVSRKRRRYWVMWDAALVGGLLEPGPIAKLR